MQQQKAAQKAHRDSVRKANKDAGGGLTLHDRFDFEDLFEDMDEEEKAKFEEEWVLCAGLL